MNQSRKHSLAECISNIAIGYVVALASQLAIFPLFDIHVSFRSNIMIGLYFTVVSLVRSYALRWWWTGRHTCPRAQLVADHAAAMHRTLNLPKNAGKGSWSHLQLWDLLRLVEQELSEFHGAVWGFETGRESVERVESEAADVSNYCAMIVDNCRSRQK